MSLRIEWNLFVEITKIRLTKIERTPFGNKESVIQKFNVKGNI